MILQRLATSIRKQDWFTVVIETLVGVFGVYLGIQLGNWNASRGERVEERALVMRLIEDAEATGEALEEAITASDESAQAAARIHRTMLSGQVEDEAQFAADLFTMGPYTGTAFITATLDQAIASGRIRIIRSSALQGDIAAYREAVEGRVKSIDGLGEMNIDDFKAIHDRFDADWSAPPKLVTPLDDIIADDIVSRRIGQLYNQYKYIHENHQYSDRFNDEYEAALKAYAREEGWIE